MAEERPEVSKDPLAESESSERPLKVQLSSAELLSSDVGIFPGRGRPSNPVAQFMMYLRLLAGFHICFGCYIWLYLIGVIYAETAPFGAQPFSTQVYIIFASIISFVAAQGLWMLAPWGISMWLLLAVVVGVSSLLSENPVMMLGLFMAMQFIFLIFYLWLRHRYEKFIEDFGYSHDL